MNIYFSNLLNVTAFSSNCRTFTTFSPALPELRPYIPGQMFAPNFAWIASRLSR